MLDHAGDDAADHGARRDPGPHRRPRRRGVGSAAPAGVRAGGDPRPPAGRARRHAARAARARRGRPDPPQRRAAWRSATTCAGWPFAAHPAGRRVGPAPPDARRARRRVAPAIPRCSPTTRSAPATGRACCGAPRRRAARPPAPARTPRRRRSSRPRSTAAPRWTRGSEAELLELLADEYYLIDRLDDAIAACRRAMQLRQELGDVGRRERRPPRAGRVPVVQRQPRLAEDHVAQRSRCSTANRRRGRREAGAARPRLRHAGVPRAAGQRPRRAGTRLSSRAREIADAGRRPDAGGPRRADRGLCARARGRRPRAATRCCRSSQRGPTHFDEIYSSGYSNLTYLDVEQRRLDAAADLLDVSIPLTIERDLPICRVGSSGSRAGSAADRRLGRRASPTPTTCSTARARRWPGPGRTSIRGLVALRRTAAEPDDLDEAWGLARRFGEPMRMLPAAAALVETGGSPAPPTTASTSAGRCSTDGARRGPGVGPRRAGGVAASARRSASTRSASPSRTGCCSTGRTRRPPHEFDRLATPYERRSPSSTRGDRRAGPRAASTCSTGSAPTPWPPRSAATCGRRGVAAVPARRAVRDAGQPGRAHRRAGRGAAPARRRAHERRARRAAVHLGEDRRPPRVGDPHQAPGDQAARRGSAGA